MTALLVVPDYVSHYLPLSAVGAALRDRGRDVVVATGEGLRERVLADGFEHVALRLGAGSNARTDTDAEGPGASEFLAATYGGMVPTLELQARRRLDDLLWEPEHVTASLEGIVRDVGPSLVLSDQLSFGASLGLRALGVAYTSFLPGHPCQLPPRDTPFGFPVRRPAGFATDAQLVPLRALCTNAAHAFTRRFNEALLSLAPHARPVEDAFVEGGPQGTLVNYPARLADRSVAARATLVGPCVRDERGDPELEALERGGDPPRAYVALGSFLSARGDVLRRIADALRAVRSDAVIASGVTPPDELGPLPDSWVVRAHLPQVAALRACDVVICHGGNNTVMEALSAGLPVVALPFSTDQFAVAADVVAAGVGAALDPNRADADDLATALRRILDRGPRERARALGRELRRAPGPSRAAGSLLAGPRSDRDRH